MDLSELNQAITAYQNSAPTAGPVIDWRSLLTLLPALLSIFIPNPAIAAVVTQIVQVILNVFFPAAGAHFKVARATQAATPASLVAAISNKP